jgi:hypothetical protein
MNLKENVESVAMKELKKSGQKTVGFSVGGAPFWLFEELRAESKEYYNSVYWPVLVDWYRKAKMFEQLSMGNVASVEQKYVEQPDKKEEEKEESKRPVLFGR